MKVNALRKTFDEYMLSEKIHKLREIYLVADGMCFKETGTLNAFCLVVFRDEVTPSSGEGFPLQE